LREALRADTYGVQSRLVEREDPVGAEAWRMDGRYRYDPSVSMARFAGMRARNELSRAAFAARNARRGEKRERDEEGAVSNGSGEASTSASASGGRRAEKKARIEEEEDVEYEYVELTMDA
jgi:hypothetical protein